MRIYLICSLLFVAVATVKATAQTQQELGVPQTQTLPAGCRSGNPLANLAHPKRFEVLADCITVSGEVVEDPTIDDDGNLEFTFKPDATQAFRFPQQFYVAPGSSFHIGLAWIVPADMPGCVRGEKIQGPRKEWNYGNCTGVAIVPPKHGERVEITGPYVRYKYGPLIAGAGQPYVTGSESKPWNGIAPVWSLKTLRFRLTKKPRDSN